MDDVRFVGLSLEVDRQIEAASTGTIPVCCGEERPELEGKALNLPDDLYSNPHLLVTSCG